MSERFDEERSRQSGVSVSPALPASHISCERLTVDVGTTADVVDKYLAEGRRDY